jgi:hypothetical protein
MCIPIRYRSSRFLLPRNHLSPGEVSYCIAASHIVVAKGAPPGRCIIEASVSWYTLGELVVPKDSYHMLFVFSLVPIGSQSSFPPFHVYLNR